MAMWPTTRRTSLAGRRSERLGSAREERLKILGYVAHSEEDFFGR